MTSPNFMYPQPTDDELAAQVRAGAPPDLTAHSQAPPHGVVGSGPTVPVSAAGSRPPGSPFLGKAALALTLVAAGVTLVASAVLGITVGPEEAANGSYFGGESWRTTLGVTLFGLQALCAVVGLTGLTLGIVATVTDRGRTPGIIATAVAVIAPIVSFALFIILSFAMR